MAPQKRKTLDERSAAAQRLRKGMPTYVEMAPYFANEGAAVEYLIDQNVLTIPICTTCGGGCVRRGGTWIYRCQRHKYQISLVSNTDLTFLTYLSKTLTSRKFADSFFSQCKFGVHLVLLILYCYAIEDSWTQVLLKTGLSQRTVTDWLRYCRQLVTEMVLVNEEDITVGGEGITVQIDESKFGKRKKTKNGRGHRVEGAWVFGGVEKGGGAWENNKYFCVVVENQTAATLLPLIER